MEKNKSKMFKTYISYLMIIKKIREKISIIAVSIKYVISNLIN